MNQIVVDSDVASYIFNWHSSAPRYVEALRNSALILSFMSVAEMRMGSIAAGWGARRRTMLEHFIGGFGIVFADDALCSSWARLRAEARMAGIALGPQDAWIAATALALDATLATNNRSDFQHVPKLRLLVA